MTPTRLWMTRLAVWLALWFCMSASMSGQTLSPEAEQFFERRIRPLLTGRCVECHGPQTQESGLRLDSRKAILAGGDSGPAVVIDQPRKSRLAVAVGYSGELQMPPDEKLPDDQIRALLRWIEMGLPWPDADAELAAPDKQSPAERAENDRAEHWAYQPVKRPKMPPVAETARIGNEVDHFILARLEAAGLRLSPPADRRTLIRRATFDLVGLPPTSEEVADFQNDPSPDALANVIDRLLASPRYGQRWGRHWLDVARYADTKGYVFTQEPRYPYAYTYRDYVIRAFNEDLPYDQFIVQQLAADQLDLGDDRRALAAMGFLTVGRRFSNNIHDIIDDRIDVVTRGLLGLTVTCARCHAHKYDAIPTEDYYSLYGVFASSTEPSDMPLIALPDETEAYRKYQEELAKRQQTFDSFVDEEHRKLVGSLRKHVTAYLVEAAREKAEGELPDATFISLGPGELNPRVVRRWREYLEKTAKDHHPVFAPWHALAGLQGEEFGARATQVLEEFSAGQVTEGNQVTAEDPATINSRVLSALGQTSLSSMIDVARAYGQLLTGVDEQWQKATAETTSMDKLPDAADEQLRTVLYDEETPTVVPRNGVRRYFEREARNRYNELKQKVDNWKVSSPDAPPRAMTLVDAQRPVQPRVFIRGNSRRPGDEVPRQYLAVLSGEDRKPFSQGSGRLELARAIASPDNPLTARVWMNRVWMHHFGAPLVSSPSDFGVRSDPPTHPGLLDYLAVRFREGGYTLKNLHRLIMLSSTYGQSSADVPHGRTVDPENRLLWRMNRRRLEFEAYRDALLSAAGQLDTSPGGRPVSLTDQPFSRRRTVYGFIDRQILPGLFRTFDFANPDASSPGRPHTTVPQQALFAMNSPFAIQQAKHLAARPEVASREDPARRTQALYRIALSRPASDDEVRLALAFIRAASAVENGSEASDSLTPWQQYAQALLMTNEFAFVD